MSMKTNVTVRILDTDYPLVCDVHEKELLTKSAEVLNKHLKAFRRSNPSIETEQLVIMGALRATCDLVNEIDTLSDRTKIANSEIAKTLKNLNLSTNN